MSFTSNDNTYAPVGINKDNLVVLDTSTSTDNISLHSSNNDSIDIINIKTLLNKDSNKELHLSAFDGSTIYPIIKINNTHQHVNITSNLDMSNNIINNCDFGYVSYIPEPSGNSISGLETPAGNNNTTTVTYNNTTLSIEGDCEFPAPHRSNSSENILITNAFLLMNNNSTGRHGTLSMKVNNLDAYQDTYFEFSFDVAFTDMFHISEGYERIVIGLFSKNNLSSGFNYTDYTNREPLVQILISSWYTQVKLFIDGVLVVDKTGIDKSTLINNNSGNNNNLIEFYNIKVIINNNNIKLLFDDVLLHNDFNYDSSIISQYMYRKDYDTMFLYTQGGGTETTVYVKNILIKSGNNKFSSITS